MGQKVETSLVQGLTGYDLYNWLGPQLPAEFAGPAADRIHVHAGLGDRGLHQGRPLAAIRQLPTAPGGRLPRGDRSDRGLQGGHGPEATRPPALNELVLRRLHEKTLDEWMEIFLRSDDIGVEPFRTPTEALDHPQAIHNGNVVDVVDPRLGKTRQVGPLV